MDELAKASAARHSFISATIADAFITPAPSRMTAAQGVSRPRPTSTYTTAIDAAVTGARTVDAQVYRQTPLAAEDMSHIRGVLQFILNRHRPYAAVVLDRYSTCLMGNGASARRLAAVVNPSLISEHANHLRMVFHPLGARRCIVNGDAVSRHLLARAQRELKAANDDAAAALLAELQGYAGPDRGARSTAAVSAADSAPALHLNVDGVELRLFSTIMTLGTPQDVTLQELRVETFFPADAASEKAWAQLTAEP